MTIILIAPLIQTLYCMFRFFKIRLLIGFIVVSRLDSRKTYHLTAEERSWLRILTSNINQLIN